MPRASRRGFFPSVNDGRRSERPVPPHCMRRALDGRARSPGHDGLAQERAGPRASAPSPAPRRPPREPAGPRPPRAAERGQASATASASGWAPAGTVHNSSGMVVDSFIPGAVEGRAATSPSPRRARTSRPASRPPPPSRRSSRWPSRRPPAACGPRRRSWPAGTPAVSVVEKTRKVTTQVRVVRLPVPVEIPEVERAAGGLLRRRHHRHREGEDDRRLELVEGRLGGRVREHVETPDGRFTTSSVDGGAAGQWWS